MTHGIAYLTAEDVRLKRERDPDTFILDVRTEPEWETHHIPGATLIPMQDLPERIGELDPQREIIVVCEHGVRSENVAAYLASQGGFRIVCNMIGGMSAWAGEWISGPAERERS